MPLKKKKAKPALDNTKSLSSMTAWELEDLQNRITNELEKRDEPLLRAIEKLREEFASFSDKKIHRNKFYKIGERFKILFRKTEVVLKTHESFNHNWCNINILKQIDIERLALFDMLMSKFPKEAFIYVDRYKQLNVEIGHAEFDISISNSKVIVDAVIDVDFCVYVKTSCLLSDPNVAKNLAKVVKKISDKADSLSLIPVNSTIELEELCDLVK